MTGELNDEAVYERLDDALVKLGDEEGSTPHGDTAIQSAKRVLRLLQMALAVAMERKSRQPGPSPSEPQH